MPPIEHRLLKATVYLYKSEQSAKDGEPGGSGFIVGLPTDIPEAVLLLAVSNAHVVDGHPVVRTYGPAEKRVIPRTFPDWIRHPDGDDLMVTPIGFAPSQCADYYLDYVPARWIVTPTDFTEPVSSPPPGPLSGPPLASTSHASQQPLYWPFGPGDDIVMVGRFLGHDGVDENRPAVRFGNLAIEPPVPIDHPWKFQQESFVVECRSLSGYSGSPVFIFRPWPLYGMPLPVGLTLESEPRLLGIDWGNLDRVATNTYEIDWAPDKQAKASISKKFPAVSGMMVAIPGWKLSDLLTTNEVRTMVEDEAAKAKKAFEGVTLDLGEDEFARFEDLTRKLVQVPKKELDAKRKES